MADDIYVTIADATPINVTITGLSSSAEHGELLGLSDDDHPQYLLTDGTRPLTGSTPQDGATIYWDGDNSRYQNSETLAIDESVSRVGIGTNTPTAKLEITGSVDIIQAIITGITSQVNDIMQVGDVASGNYLAVEADGHFRLAGNATVTRDENFSATRLLATGGAKKPDLINIPGTNILIPAFQPNKTQEGSDHKELQHDYKHTTDLRPHLHWWPSDANTGTVRWGLEYFIKSGITVLAQGTTYVDSPAPGATWQEVITEFDDVINGLNLTIANQISFRFFRDGTHVNDTYPSDAAVTTYGYHYVLDGLGSRGTFAK